MRKTAKRNILLLTLLAVCLSACVNAQQVQREQKVDQAVSDYVNLAQMYLQKGRPNGAKHYLFKAKERRPKNPSVQNALATYYRYMNEPDQQEKHLKLALEYDGDYAPARNNYGIMLTKQGRYDEAIKQFLHAATDLENTDAGLAYANLGRCYELDKQVDKAIWAYKKAIRLNYHAPAVYLALTSIYFERHQFDTAQQYYKKYTKADKTQSAAGLWMGIQLAAISKDEDAKASYEMALENLYPKSSEYKAWKHWSRSEGGH